VLDISNSPVYIKRFVYEKPTILPKTKPANAPARRSSLIKKKK
jgi:hypothetical protein